MHTSKNCRGIIRAQLHLSFRRAACDNVQNALPTARGSHEQHSSCPARLAGLRNRIVLGNDFANQRFHQCGEFFVVVVEQDVFLKHFSLPARLAAPRTKRLGKQQTRPHDKEQPAGKDRQQTTHSAAEVLACVKGRLATNFAKALRLNECHSYPRWYSSLHQMRSGGGVDNRAHSASLARDGLGNRQKGERYAETEVLSGSRIERVGGLGRIQRTRGRIRSQGKGHHFGIDATARSKAGSGGTRGRETAKAASGHNLLGGRVKVNREVPMTMTQADIQRIMDAHPQLNEYGIGVYDDKAKPSVQEAELAEGKAKLLGSAEACNRVCEWLKGVKKIRAINWDQTSYGLKHLAERDGDYCSNGAFIVAAIHSGFPYRIEPGNAYVYFGMSKKSIKAIRDRQNHVVR
ncbi:MAG: hypothetical protein KF691_08555 [Phycisphaeraceae bacterium]|nr:hypothetical protein [Phycisphaeraceae bacterium]